LLLVSACLVGFRCRYNRSSKENRGVLDALDGKTWIAVCPEQRAGLPTPRDPIMFAGGTGQDVLKGRAKIVCKDGADVTAPLWKASLALCRQAKGLGIVRAVLKEKSPSCGVCRTYLGDRVVKGMGLFAALLAEEGIEVVGDETFVMIGHEKDDV